VLSSATIIAWTWTQRPGEAHVAPGPNVRDFLLLNSTGEQLAKLPPEQRDQTLHQLALIRQRAEAADVLQAEGHRAEAWRIADSALSPALEVVAALGDDADAAFGSLRERLQRAQAESREAPGPQLDADLDDGQALSLAELVDLLLEVKRRLDVAAMGPAELRRSRALRLLALATAPVLLAALGWQLWFAPPPLRASASAVLGNDYAHDAERAIDGDPATAWLLPDNSPGHLEVLLPEPQTLTELRLLNVDRDAPDVRATRDYRVDFYVQGKVVQSLEGRWKRAGGQPTWTKHALGLEGVERIRFEVVTWFPLGGGLAEIQWSPR